MDAAFLQDIHISLQSDPLALKFKSYYDIPSFGDVQNLDSYTRDSEVIDLNSPNLSGPFSRINRSQEGEMPQDDTDPRFQFHKGLLYYQELLYVSEGPY